MPLTYSTRRKHVAMFTNLIGNWSAMADRNHAVTEMAELLAHNTIGLGASGIVMVWAVDENTYTWGARALVVEISLHRHVGRRSMLGEIRKRQSLVVKDLEELTLER